MGATTFAERMGIGKLSKEGLTDRQSAGKLGLSIPTVRKWRRRWERAGRAGLVSRMGRPRPGALSTFGGALVEQLRVWRKQHPGWGSKTLRAELELEDGRAGKRLPARSPIARWLKENQMVRLYEKHSQLPAKVLSPTQACHEEWEMDARGYERVQGAGIISLIDINDVFSRVKLLSYPCWLGDERRKRFPAAGDYRQALRLAFAQWGLPDRLATDHDRIFYDETSKSPFPTRFHLWLIALGIELVFGRMRTPKDQAVTERSHQTWDQQVLQGARFENYQHLWKALGERQIFLNQFLPCASLGEIPPLVAHPEARFPRRPYRPEWEAELIDLEKVHAYLAEGQWFRKVSSLGAISIGGHIYHPGYHWRPDVYVELTFDPLEKCFLCSAPGGKPAHLPADWLTPVELMGELRLAYQIPPFQFALPFSWNEWRAWQYFAMPASRL
jgi:hypothetical protein